MVDDGRKTLKSPLPDSYRERGEKHYCLAAERQCSGTRWQGLWKPRKDEDIKECHLSLVCLWKYKLNLHNFLKSMELLPIKHFSVGMSRVPEWTNLSMWNYMPAGVCWFAWLLKAVSLKTQHWQPVTRERLPFFFLTILTNLQKRHQIVVLL